MTSYGAFHARTSRVGLKYPLMSRVSTIREVKRVCFKIILILHLRQIGKETEHPRGKPHIGISMLGFKHYKLIFQWENSRQAASKTPPNHKYLPSFQLGKIMIPGHNFAPRLRIPPLFQFETFLKTGQIFTPRRRILPRF